MDRKEKVKLLSNLLQGRKPDMNIYIVHTDDGLIIDTDNSKLLKLSEEEEYIKQIQKDNPLYNVVCINITADEYKRVSEQLEQEV